MRLENGFQAFQPQHLSQWNFLLRQCFTMPEVVIPNGDNTPGRQSDEDVSASEWLQSESLDGCQMPNSSLPAYDDSERRWFHSCASLTSMTEER